MACTTILVGKKASYDGSTMIARNDDSPSGSYTPKKLAIVSPDEQPRLYRSVISHVKIELPDNPMRYSSVPNALEGEGLWAGAGVNEANVAMTATETIESNERVLGADPLVVLQKAAGDKAEIPGGIGEEDYPTIVLPYIRSAREGVLRTAELLEKYGTYEMNGIAFADVNEIWWMETFGGHHWIARRVPDDQYVVMPNQSGIDFFDLEDALGEGKDYLCSKDLREFIAENHLDLTMDQKITESAAPDQECASGNSKAFNLKTFNPRDAFGTHSDSDHIYNTPRAWYMCRYFNPHSADWDGRGGFFGLQESERKDGRNTLAGAGNSYGLLRSYRPMDDDLPWSMVPEKKITVEDVKYILSSHFQGTPYDPYSRLANSSKGDFRCIGVNRTDFLALLQLRPYVPAEICAVEWLTFGSNVYNTFVPFYPNTDRVPAYLSTTDKQVDTESFYWNCRLIAALADAQYAVNSIHIERYQIAVMSKAHELLKKYDREVSAAAARKNADDKADSIASLIISANEEIAAMVREKTSDALGKVLLETSNKMRNSFARSDA